MAFKNLTTALILLGVFQVSVSFRIIESPPITNFGSWGKMEECPPGTRAQAFQLKTEWEQGGGDDTALNGIRFFCGHPELPDTVAITSSVGVFGRWGGIKTCYPGNLTDFHIRVEPIQLGGDDTATNNMRFYCTLTGTFMEGDGLWFGSWYEPPASGCVICGIQTQVEWEQGSGDDTALNNVRFKCCD